MEGYTKSRKNRLVLVPSGGTLAESPATTSRNVTCPHQQGTKEVSYSPCDDGEILLVPPGHPHASRTLETIWSRRRTHRAVARIALTRRTWTQPQAPPSASCAG